MPKLMPEAIDNCLPASNTIQDWLSEKKIFREAELHPSSPFHFGRANCQNENFR